MEAADHSSQARTAPSHSVRWWFAAYRGDLWLLTALWSLISLVIFYLATGHVSPRRFQDEFLWYAVGESFAAGDGLTWRGESLDLLSPLYPIMLAPAFWFSESVAGSYTLVHLLDSLYMSAVVFPAYFLARRFVQRPAAYFAALMAASIPAMNYAGVIGTESLAYPVATAAFAAVIPSIERPSPRTWLLAGIGMLIAVLTRTQFVVFAPIYIAAIVLAGVGRRPGDRASYFRSQFLPLAAAAAVVVLALLILLVFGRGALGLYAGVFEGVMPTLEDVWYWFKAFVADIYLMTAIIPVIAAMALGFRSGNWRDPATGALLAVTAAATAGFLIEVTWFSATNPYDWRSRNIFYERYMFYLAPLFFTAFLASWRRVSFAAAISAAAIAAVVITGFQRDAVLIPFSYDSFGLSLVGWLMDAQPDIVEQIGMVMAMFAVPLGLIYCLTTATKVSVARPALYAASLLTIGLLAIGQAKTWSYARTFSADAFEGYPKPADFIDKATDQPVGMIVTSTDAPEMYFSAEFWNKRIVRAFATQDEPIRTPIMYSPRCPFDWDEHGLILATGCDLVPAAFYLRSENVSIHLKDETLRKHPSRAHPNLTLFAGEPPARLLAMMQGRNTISGDVSSAFEVWTFLDDPGRMRLTLDARRRAVTVKIGDRPSFVPPGGKTTISAALPRGEEKTLIQFEERDGTPINAVVEDVEVRSGEGPWISVK